MTAPGRFPEPPPPRSPPLPPLFPDPEESRQLRHLRRDLPQGVVVEGNGTDPDVLENAGIGRANVVAAVTGADETNLVVIGLARFEFKVPRTIARVKNPRNAWMFTPEMGVDVALNQTDLLAHLVAEEMSLGDMMTLLKLRKGQYSLVEEKVHPTAVAADKALRDLKLPDQCVLAAVIRKASSSFPAATSCCSRPTRSSRWCTRRSWRSSQVSSGSGKSGGRERGIIAEEDRFPPPISELPRHINCEFFRPATSKTESLRCPAR